MRSNLAVEGVMLTPNNYKPQVDVHFYKCNYENGECTYSNDYYWQPIYVGLIKGNYYGKVVTALFKQRMKDRILPRCRWRKLGEK